MLLAFLLCSAGICLALLGGGDVNVITGTETYPDITQNHSSTWGHGDTVVIVYNDLRGQSSSPRNTCGISVSTNGGETFTRLVSPFTGSGSCNGDGAVFYSRRAAKWFASFSVDSGCTNSIFGTGDGIRQWSSTDGITWTLGSCIAKAAFADNTFRFDALINHNAWIDNNSASPAYGTQYAIFNDIQQQLKTYVATSTDDGATWSSPFSINSTKNRALQITGSLGSDATIFVQTVDERDGGLNTTRTNYNYRRPSNNLWEEHFQGPTFFDATFLGPGRVNCSDLPSSTCMYAPGYWNEEAWGQLAVGPNNVVHYFYGARPYESSDPGDIMYVKSTDNGATWSIPVKFNTDTSNRAQWNPSAAINAQGLMVVSWYDERNTSGNNLERYARVSLDNGATWGAEMPISDNPFPVPLRPDSSSDIGRHTFAAFSDDGFGGDAYLTWIDGRNSINGSPQQDIYFDKISLIPPTTFIVTTLIDHDDGTCDASDCTLREAINGANTHSGKDFIKFAAGLTGTIQLASVLPNISTSMEIQGPGADVISVRRNTSALHRIFTIDNGTTNGPTVSISGLTMTNGSVGGSSFPGNAGGGVYSNHSKLTLTNCVISDNLGGFTGGGGIYNNGGGSAAATLTLKGCTVSGNNAPSTFGGGIYNSASGTGTATLTVENCTFSGNSAGSGGGIFNFGGGSAGNGSVVVRSTTFAGNSANGSAIFNDRDTSAAGAVATLTIGNNIFKHGTGGNFLSDGTITSLGHNIASDAANGPGGTAPGGYLNATGDVRNTDPLIDPNLINNGGPTPTHALLVNSPAINNGDSVLAPTRDQRGYFRAGASDMGAFEYQGGFVGKFTAIVWSGADILPTCEVVSGHTYRLRRKLNLTDASWIDVIDVAAVADTATFPDANAVSLGRGFYQVGFVH
jgi:CSLREA domain-containing protein